MGVIRLLLALAVVSTHCGSIKGFELVGGKVAVQTFYIISGFYMSLVISEKYIGINNSYKLFISNRLLKLLPIYWFVLILTILFSLTILNNNAQELLYFKKLGEANYNIFTYFSLIFSNIFVVGQDIIMFLKINPETGGLLLTPNFWDSTPPLFTYLFIPQAWTIGVEISFYLIAPFILRLKPKYVIAILTASILLRLLIYHYLNLKNDPWTYRFFPTELMFFLGGYISYQFFIRLKKTKLNKWISFLIISFFIIFTYKFYNLPDWKPNLSPFMIKELLYFLTAIVTIPVIFSLTKKNKIDNIIGDLSYPVYISHILIINLFGKIPKGILNNHLVLILTIIAFSFTINKIISVPLEKYRQKRLQNQPVKHTF